MVVRDWLLSFSVWNSTEVLLAIVVFLKRRSHKDLVPLYKNWGAGDGFFFFLSFFFFPPFFLWQRALCGLPGDGDEETTAVTGISGGGLGAPVRRPCFPMRSVLVLAGTAARGGRGHVSVLGLHLVSSVTEKERKRKREGE